MSTTRAAATGREAWLIDAVRTPFGKLRGGLSQIRTDDLAAIMTGVTLTVGSVGWLAGAFLQSQSWLSWRRDQMIIVGVLGITVGIALLAATAFFPNSWLGFVMIAWIIAGFGMGLQNPSTSLAVMSLSEPAVQGRNGSSLNLSDALGAGLFVGVSGTIFAALHDATELSVTFGAVLGTMTIIAGLAALASLRIGPVRNEFSAAPES